MEDVAPDTYVNTQECCFFSMGIIALKITLRVLATNFIIIGEKLSSSFVWSIAYQNPIINKRFNISEKERARI